MPTALNISTNFNGEVAGGYIAQMVRGANTISDNLVTILPNVVSKQYIRKIRTASGFVDYVCGFTPDGSITLEERVLDVKKIKEDRQLCKEDFRQLWTAQEMGFSAHNDNLPATEQAAILEDMGKRLSLKIDREIWRGDGLDGNLNGFIPALLADSELIGIEGAAITTANVEEKVGAFIDAHKDDFFESDGNWIFGVSTNVLRRLKRAYGKAVRQAGTFLSPSEFEFEGYILTEIKGLPSDTMIGYNKENLFFGTGLISDHNEIKVVDEDEVGLLSGQIRTKIVLTGGVQYASAGEVVLYSPQYVAPV